MIDRLCSLLKMKIPERNRGLLFASGTVVPADETDGYQTGCVFQHTDGGDDTALYVNEGSVTSCDFNPVTIGSAGEMSAVQFNDDLTGPLISISTEDPTGASYETPFLITGTYSSTCSLAIQLNTSNKRPVSFLFDDGGAALAGGDYRATLSRVLLCTAQTNAITLNALRGQIKALDTIGVTSASSVTAPITGYLELYGTSARTLNGHVACVRAALEEGASGTTTVGKYLAGFEATLNSTRVYAGAGLSAAFLADISGGTSKWQYGIYVEGGSVATAGLQLGSDGAPAGDLFAYGELAGSYLQWDEDANSCGRLNVANSTIRASQLRSLNECMSAFRMYYDSTQENKSARSVLSETYVNAAVVVTGTNYHEINAINGETILQDTCQLNGSGLCVSGVKGEIRGSGTQTECNFLTCVLAKMNNAVELGTGDSSLFRGWSHSGVVDFGLQLVGETGGTMTTAIGMADATATYAFSFPAAGTAPVSTYTTEEAPTGKIAILVGGDTRYLAYWD